MCGKIDSVFVYVWSTIGCHHRHRQSQIISSILSIVTITITITIAIVAASGIAIISITSLRLHLVVYTRARGFRVCLRLPVATVGLD